MLKLLQTVSDNHGAALIHHAEMEQAIDTVLEDAIATKRQIDAQIQSSQECSRPVN